MKKIIYSVVLLLVLAVIGIVYFIFNKPHRDVDSEKPSIQISAADLFANYSEKEKVSDSLYLNKVIEVNGKIGEITQDQKGERMLVLEGDGMFGVVCSMDELDRGNKKKVEALKVGDKVTLKGICNGFDSDVKLNKCVLLEVANDNPQSI